MKARSVCDERERWAPHSTTAQFDDDATSRDNGFLCSPTQLRAFNQDEATQKEVIDEIQEEELDLFFTFSQRKQVRRRSTHKKGRQTKTIRPPRKRQEVG